MLAVGTSRHVPVICPLQQSKIDQEAIYWRMNNSQKEVLAQLRFRAREVPTTFARWTSEMYSISWVSAQERVVIAVDGASDHLPALHHEQKRVSWMKNVIRNFTSPGQTVVPLSAATLATAKAEVLLL